MQRIKRTFVYGVTWIALDRENRVVGFLLAESKGDRFDLPYGGVRKCHRGHNIFPDLVEKVKEIGRPLTATVKHANKSDIASSYKTSDLRRRSLMRTSFPMPLLARVGLMTRIHFDGSRSRFEGQ